MILIREYNFFLRLGKPRHQKRKITYVISVMPIASIDIRVETRRWIDIQKGSECRIDFQVWKRNLPRNSLQRITLSVNNKALVSVSAARAAEVTDKQSFLDKTLETEHKSAWEHFIQNCQSGIMLLRIHLKDIDFFMSTLCQTQIFFFQIKYMFPFIFINLA